MGGPPCQGFSYAGKMDINDERNFLYLAMVKLTEKLKPKAVLLENVLAMIEANGGVGAKRVIDDFDRIGYKMVPKVLFAPEYGVPQIRKRVFFVGLRDSAVEFEFPSFRGSGIILLHVKKLFLICLVCRREKEIF